MDSPLFYIPVPEFQSRLDAIKFLWEHTGKEWSPRLRKEFCEAVERYAKDKNDDH